MESFADGLVSGDSAKRISVKRGKQVNERLVTAAKQDALATKVLGEEKDGWSVVKRNKKSVRMTKSKLPDQQLEDDIWSLLYRLGFKEFNADRNFTIKLGRDAPGRQIDVFAKDDDTVFIVECTHSHGPAPKSIKGLIDKINGIKQRVVHAVHAHYGKKPKLKVKWGIATRNVVWRKADKDRANEANIAIITENDITYYTKLIKHLKGAARYQFLARYLKGENVPGLRMEVPATRGKMGKTTFYNFLISPLDLLKVSYISHKGGELDDLETYQRMVKTSRLNQIASYIDGGGRFPTNVVINFKTRKSTLTFSKIESFGDSVFGRLVLPGLYGSAWIIDGQHRLYGFAFAKRSTKHLVSVLAYENLPSKDERNQFVEINSKQVKVSRNLLNEIYSTLNFGSDDPAEHLEAISAKVVLLLDERHASPVHNSLITVSKSKDSNRCLTLTNFIDGIKENHFIGQPKGKRIEAGPMTDVSEKPDLTIVKAADVIEGYLRVFAEGAREHWQLRDAKGGFLCTNNGIRALFRLLRELIAFIERHDHIRAATTSAEDIVKAVSVYAEALAEHFQNASPDDILRFRSEQALKGVKKNTLSMMWIISDAKLEFTTPELKEYIESQDKEGTKAAFLLINEIDEIVSKDVINQLKITYREGEDKWWWEGVPQSIRKACNDEWDQNKGEKERWQYMFMRHYQTIVSRHWNVFKERYDLFGDARTTADRGKWITKINAIRQTTHHPIKGFISKEQVTYVRTIAAKVKEKIGTGSSGSLASY